MVVSNAVLSALFIPNLSLKTSLVGFILDQKHHARTNEVHWTGNPVQLGVLPEHLWTDPGYESDGVAGYRFFLGVYGVFVTWWLIRRQSRVSFMS